MLVVAARGARDVIADVALALQGGRGGHAPAGGRRQQLPGQNMSHYCQID